MTELLIAVGLIGGVVAAHEFHFSLGSLDRSADKLFRPTGSSSSDVHGRSSCVFDRLRIFRGGIALHRPARHHRKGGECTRHRLPEGRYNS